jgi:hypothetical protein
VQELDCALTTTLEDENISNKLNIYPNPVKDILQLPNNSNYTISNLQGCTLATGTGEQGDVSTLPQGVYLINIEGRVAKFVKE